MILFLVSPASGFSQTSKSKLFITISQTEFLNESYIQQLEEKFDIQLTASDNSFPKFQSLTERNDSTFAVIIKENESSEEIYLNEDSTFLSNPIYWIACGTVVSILILYYTRF